MSRCSHHFAPEYDKDLAISVKMIPKAGAALLEADGWKRDTTESARRTARDYISRWFLVRAPHWSIKCSNKREQIGPQSASRWRTKLYDGGLFFAPISEGGIVDGGHFEVFALWSPGAVFADSFPAQFDCSLIPPNGNNDFRYCNRHLQPILHQIERTYDPIALAPLCQAITTHT